MCRRTLRRTRGRAAARERRGGAAREVSAEAARLRERWRLRRLEELRARFSAADAVAAAAAETELAAVQTQPAGRARPAHTCMCHEEQEMSLTAGSHGGRSEDASRIERLHRHASPTTDRAGSKLTNSRK